MGSYNMSFLPEIITEFICTSPSLKGCLCIFCYEVITALKEGKGDMLMEMIMTHTFRT